MAKYLLDKLTRSFLVGTSNPYGTWSESTFDAFKDVQDPTFLTFRLDFFPDGGLSMPTDSYSSGGLLREFNKDVPGGINAYGLYDSAAEYLYRIGAPARQAYLEKFTYLLGRLQEEAPWYFQSVSGLAELYKLDPAINFRGKDKVLTIECLESLDLRMTLLADLYRNIAFDFEYMREVLPINLRTFNMNVHVLEFRKFNTTFGIIADALDNTRAVKGQSNQKDILDAENVKNVYSPSTSLFAGALDNIAAIGNRLNDLTGGIFGQGAPEDKLSNLKSAFEAISVQTFRLRDCEFDFFSEAPGYLDVVSVKDIQEATFKFKIKVGKIEKFSTYSFDKYVISEFAKNSSISPANIPQGVTKNFTPSNPYFEQRPLDAGQPDSYFAEYRESIFPTFDLDTAGAQANAYKRQLDASNNLRKKPLERLLGNLINDASGIIRDRVQEGLGQLTGGLLGTAPLGNVYGDPTFLQRAAQSLNDFLTPGNQITTGQTSATPPRETLRNISFDTLNLDRTPPENNVYSATPPITNTDNVQGDNVYLGTPPLPTSQVGDINVFEGTPPLPTSQVGDVNVFQGTLPLPTDDLGKENVFQGSPPPPTEELPGNENVFK